MPASSDVSVLTLQEQMQDRLQGALSDLVPWFLQEMPRAYFQDTDEATRADHLMALLAARGSGLAHRMRLESRDGAVVTFVESKDEPGVLSELVAQLPRDRDLQSAKVHSAADASLVLDVFRFGRKRATSGKEGDSYRAKQDEAFEFGKAHNITFDVELLRAYFEGCSADYVEVVPAARLFENFQLWLSVRGTEETEVRRTPRDDSGWVRIDVAAGDVDARLLFERVVWLLGARGLQIGRAFLDRFESTDSTGVAVLGFVVRKDSCPEGEGWSQLEHDLRRIRWVDERVIDLFKKTEGLTLLESEVLMGMSDLAHAKLARAEPFAFSRDRIFERLIRYLNIARDIAVLFLERTKSGLSLSDADLSAQAEAIRACLEQSVDEEPARRLFDVFLDVVQAVLRCNVWVPGRYGLAMRLEPQFFDDGTRSARPFGIFFVHGRGFDGFHVRFTNIARGGVRVVRTRSREQHGYEAARLFDEVYGLAFAQQLKNKDIPEGGSKAVILAEPSASLEQSVKAFADGLLDLLTPVAEVRAFIVDRLGYEELLYLGPDENISPHLIEWVVGRALRRGYALPNSLMSSKPGAGINHKEFGVTSEGVTVFLEEALRAVGIDPRRDSFTVKLTGGPDGDVAGNEIRILHREYGEKVRIVGVADGSGSARDPDGIEIHALLDLVETERPIAALASSALGPRGVVLGLSAPAGVQARNNLCFEVVSDAFVPAGGRPGTIHAQNWRKFLDGEGRPSSQVIVEGANLFITPEARRALSEEAGVVIVKDSSANKCGVICSSFEITASMMLSPAEFLDVKGVFVEQVLERLRALGRREAQLLFRASRANPQAILPDLSVKLSEVILRATSAIEAGLADLDEDSRALADGLVVDHLPQILSERFADRVGRLPHRYREGIVASSLATKIVYGEGLDFFDGVSDDRVLSIAFEYLRGAREVDRLTSALARSDLPERARVAELLRRSGARASLND